MIRASCEEFLRCRRSKRVLRWPLLSLPLISMKKVSLLSALASCALLAACQGSVSDVEIDEGMQASSEAIVIDMSSSSSIEGMMDESSSSVSSVEAMDDEVSSSSEAAM
jgi:hypothetical protein